MKWLFAFTEKHSIFVLPACLTGFIALLDTIAYTTADSGIFIISMDRQQVIGTLIMHSLLPSFLLLAFSLAERRVRTVLDQFSSYAKEPNYLKLGTALVSLRIAALPIAIIFTAYGGYQNIEMIEIMFESSTAELLDVAIILGNCLTWLLISLLLCWHIPVSIALSNFSTKLEIDLFNTDLLQPIVRVATTDILIVAAAMALMPLQSLDAEFRWENYRDGAYVGAFSAIVLFTLPLVGLRQNLARSKKEKLARLHEELMRLDRNDVPKLEIHLSHIARIKSISTVPIDLQLFTRVVASVIIPPLAWVGAAMMEQFITG